MLKQEVVCAEIHWSGTSGNLKNIVYTNVINPRVFYFFESTSRN